MYLKLVGRFENIEKRVARANVFLRLIVYSVLPAVRSCLKLNICT